MQADWWGRWGTCRSFKKLIDKKLIDPINGLQHSY